MNNFFIIFRKINNFSINLFLGLLLTLNKFFKSYSVELGFLNIFVNSFLISKNNPIYNESFIILKLIFYYFHSSNLS